ncbi:hypothetical protein DENSPDRAFT_595808 [Dentipellis sp. KUC8613]|nr:hypothetical protein DENSPDRAFT_595808 [Dentipellis sp. KUC8613]
MATGTVPHMSSPRLLLLLRTASQRIPIQSYKHTPQTYNQMPAPPPPLSNLTASQIQPKPEPKSKPKRVYSSTNAKSALQICAPHPRARTEKKKALAAGARGRRPAPSFISARGCGILQRAGCGSLQRAECGSLQRAARGRRKTGTEDGRRDRDTARAGRVDKERKREKRGGARPARGQQTRHGWHCQWQRGARIHTDVQPAHHRDGGGSRSSLLSGSCTTN